MEYPRVENALNLEFSGCWYVMHEVHALRADTKSAVDSLVASGELQIKLKHKMQQDPRLSARMARQQEEYLQQIRVQARVGSLGAALATLDSHLHLVEVVVVAQEKEDEKERSVLSKSWWSNSAAALWLSIPHAISGADGDGASCAAMCRLGQAAKHHRPVMRLVQSLSNKLRPPDNGRR